MFASSQAYKKLSLVYHPDKTSGLSTEQKEECPEPCRRIATSETPLVDHSHYRCSPGIKA